MTLEKLLNKLIEKGNTKRFDLYGVEEIEVVYDSDNDMKVCQINIYTSADWPYVYSLNDLCSIDSWLRQFVIKKWLLNTCKHDCIEIENENDGWYYQGTDLEYILMICAIYEDKKQFLLDNIKIDD